MQVAIQKDYQNEPNVIADLSQALQGAERFEEQRALLTQAKNNPEISTTDRYAFQFSWVSTSFQQGHCQELLTDLENLPPQAKQEEKTYLIYVRGMCQFQQKNWVQAEQDLSQIPMSAKFFGSALDKLLESLRQQQKWSRIDEKVASVRKSPFFQLKREHFLVWAQANVELNQLQRAKEVYLIFKSALPKQLQAEDFTYWADIEVRLKNYKQSIGLYNQGLAKLKKSDLSLRKEIVPKLSQNHWQLGQKDLAIKVYQKSLYPFVKGQEKQAIALKIAKLYLDLKGQAKHARVWLQRAESQRINETSIEAILLLSRLDESQGQLDTAVNRLTKLSQKKLPNKWAIPVFSQLANFQEKQEQLQSAFATYEKVVALPRAKERVNRQLQTRAKLRIQQIKNFRGEKQIEDWIKQEQWTKIESFIQTGFKKKQLTPSVYLYEALLLAKFYLKDEKGFLSTYRLYSQKKGKQQAKLQISLMYAEILDNQKKIKDASREYRQILKRLPKSDVERQVWIARRLREIYEQLNYWKSLVITYRQVYPVLNTKELKIEFAYLLGTLYIEKLNDSQKSMEWFQKADQGGVSEFEMQAVWNIAEYEMKQQAKNALKRLEKTIRRNPSPQWKLLFYYQMAVIYQNQEKWQQALTNYRQASSQSPVPKELQTYVEESQRQIQAIQNYLQQVQSTNVGD